jgi:sphinganine-1-phosphate aldolase
MILSLVVLIRTLRPYASIAGLFLWLAYRFLRVLTPGSDWQDDPTFLHLLLDFLDDLKTKVWLRIIADYAQPTEKLVLLLLPMISFVVQILQDVAGILAVLGIARIIYCLYHFSIKEFKVILQDFVFEWAKEHVGAISKYLDDETERMAPGMVETFKKGQFKQNKLISMPVQGRNPWSIFEELAQHATKEHDQSWKTGKVSGTVYIVDETHIQLMNEVYGLYSVANILHAGVWPRLNQCEAELVAMTSTMMHGNGIGATTSGGTESIMLAIKAHLAHYGKRRHIAHPELICGSTAHASVDKACELLGIRKVCIDLNDGSNNYTLCPRKVQRHITSNTIMIYASAPCYPQGTMDPVEELGQLAEQYSIGLHVDACLGGFVLPFAQESFPVFDFQVPGVTSMSADTHKFGYAPKGTSVLLYRDNALRHAQYFCYAHWTGGMYATPTFAGSRPSALVGCAWAALVTIGTEGYKKRTTTILEASQTIADGIRQGIPELYILGNQRSSMVVCFGSEGDVDIYRVADAMTAKGWTLSSLQHPASVHVCVTLAVVPQAETFLADLKGAVADVQKEDPSHSKKGTAGIYGMAGSIPQGPVNDLLRAYIDVSLTA